MLAGNAKINLIHDDSFNRFQSIGNESFLQAKTYLMLFLMLLYIFLNEKYNLIVVLY